MNDWKVYRYTFTKSPYDGWQYVGITSLSVMQRYGRHLSFGLTETRARNIRFANALENDIPFIETLFDGLTKQEALEQESREIQKLKNPFNLRYSRVGLQKAQCTKCGEIKSLRNFYFEKKRKIHSSFCKDCCKQRYAESNYQVNVVEKKCIKCSVIKSHFHFNKRKCNRDGLSGVCKFCAKKSNNKRRKKLNNQIAILFKQCVTCKETYYADDFTLDKRSPDGLGNQCKNCHNERNRDLRKRIRYPVSVREKYCKSCNKIKSSQEFSRAYHCKSGLTTYCKKCSNLKEQERRRKHKHKHKLKITETQQELRYG